MWSISSLPFACNFPFQVYIRELEAITQFIVVATSVYMRGAVLNANQLLIRTSNKDLATTQNNENCHATVKRRMKGKIILRIPMEWG